MTGRFGAGRACPVLLLLLTARIAWPACGAPVPGVLLHAGGGLEIDRDVTVNGVEVGGSGETVDTTGARSGAAVAVPGLDPADFPGNASALEADGGDAPFSVDSGAEAFWAGIELDRDETVAFTGGGTFHIGTLSIGRDSVVELDAGVYFVDELEADRDGRLVIASGPVELHVGSSAEFDRGYDLNVGGDPSLLRIYLHEDATLSLDRDADATAMVIGPGSGAVAIDRSSSFTGILHVGGAVEVDRDTAFTLTPAQESAIAAATTCGGGGGATGPDALSITHDGAGIYCLQEPVALAAVDADGAVLSGYTGTVRIDTGTGAGSWRLGAGSGVLAEGTPGDGVAEYAFAAADDGRVELMLDYPAGPGAVSLAAVQTDDGAVADDGSHGLLTFAPTGFTVTGIPVVDPAADAGTGMPPQVAGTPFAVHLTAYGTDPEDGTCGIIEAFEGPRALLVWHGWEDPDTGGRRVVVDGVTAGAGPGAGVRVPVTFSAGQGSVAATYQDAGRITLAFRDDAGPDPIDGATGPFVVRPADLRIAAVTTPGGGANPGTTDAGAGFLAAGAPFRAVVEAVSSTGAVTPNFGAESVPERITVTADTLVWPAGGRNGSGDDGAVAGADGFVRTGGGTFEATTLAWDEVGTITLRAAVADGDYLGTGPVPASASGPVGRFFPDRFAARDRVLAGACGALAWMGQAAIEVRTTVRALAAGGSVTANYDAALLGAGRVAGPAWRLEDRDDGVPLGPRFAGPGGAFSGGELVLASTTARFDRLLAPDGPYEELRVGLEVAGDPDGVVLEGRDLDPTSRGDCVTGGTCIARALPGSLDVRYGRLRLLPAAGPETAALRLPLVTEAWDGARFRRAAVDDCTAYGAAAVSLAAFTGNLGAGETAAVAPVGPATLDGGRTPDLLPLLLSPPGEGNDGGARVTYDAPAWLEHDWTGAGVTDPTAPVRFGTWRGHDRILFWREVH